MQLLEIYSDAQGESHFRKIEMSFQTRAYVPPSAPIETSKEVPSTTSLFVAAPLGWDGEFHATPRKQFAVLLSGSITLAVTDGEEIEMDPGGIVLLNDQNSKGHQTRVLDKKGAVFFLVGLDGS